MPRDAVRGDAVRRETSKVRRSCPARAGYALLLATVVVGALSLPSPDPAAAASPGVVPAVAIRSVYTAELGVAEPAGIAYTPGDQALVVAGPAANATALVRIKGEEALGTATLPAAQAETLAFDPTRQELVVLGEGELVTVAAARVAQARPQTGRATLGAAQVNEASGAAYDGSGTLSVLDEPARVVVHIVGAGTPQARVAGRTPLTAIGPGAVRGIAYNRTDRRVYVGKPDERRLYGVDSAGQVASIIDLADAGLAAPQSFTFAPSADPTDAASRDSLYVVDAGAGEADGRVVEMTLAPVALAAEPEPAVLVQTINGFAWTPPAPDTSGLAYVPQADEFIVSDSEVEEMPIYQGANLFESTRTGSLVGTGTTTAFSNEPTGLSYRPSDRMLFVSDDNANRVTFVLPGADMQHGTSDDVRSFISTMPFSDDSEDVAYDSVSGDVFVVDGVGTQVYRVNRGPNGVFGGGDDVWSNFDVGVYGARDPEGIEHNAATNTLIIVDQPSRAMYELTPAGALIRIVDIRAASPVGAADVAVAPGSVQPDRTNFWVAARGVDNGADPNENDGKIYELSVGTAGNAAPVVDSVVVSPSAPKTNDTLTATVSAHDPDGDPLTIRYQWRKAGTPITGETGPTLDLSQPGNGDRGEVISVGVTAFDGVAQSAPRTSSQITIQNSVPVFVADLPNRTDAEGASISLSAGATDADGNTLTFEASGLPGGLAINPSTGLISGTIAAGAASASPYAVSVSVREGATPDAIDTFTWTVTTAPPQLVPSGVGVSEGNSGTKTANVTVRLNRPATTTVTVDFTTLDNSAQAPSDYEATSGTLTFVPGDTVETIPVTVKGDVVHEPRELFLVSLGNAQGATIGGFYGLAFVYVNNDDPIPVITPGSVSLPEGNSGTRPAVVPFTLDRPSASTITVDYATRDHSAQAGQDYQAQSGRLTFAPGATQVTVSVNVVGDVAREPDELFFVALANPSGAKVGGFYGLGVVSVLNDD